MIDLCYDEDSRADVDMNVVMTGSGKFIELQATAEHGSFGRRATREPDRTGAGGLGGLLKAQKNAVALP